MRAADNLALLLPDFPAPYVEHARRLTTFLRLVRDDAKAARAAAVRVSIDNARGALEQHVRQHATEVLEDLLRLHLEAELGGESFVWFDEARRDLQGAWSELETLRVELGALPTTPAPNERALAVCARLVAGLETLGAADDRRRLWSARIKLAEHGPSRAEPEFEALARSARGHERVEALCSAAECMLDRGAVRLARRFLEQHAALLAGDARAAKLQVWCALLGEDESGARALDASAPAWSRRLPRALAELRAAAPSWVALLAGRAPPDEPERPPSDVACAAPEARDDLARLRREVGACAVAFLRLAPGHAADFAHCDVAPALRERVRDWRRALEPACLEPGALEHRALVSARPAVAHRSSGAPLRHVLSSAQVQCAAAAPLCDDDGEVWGWLRFEWEHHLAPSAARLARIAASFASSKPQHAARSSAAASSTSLRDDERAPELRIEWRLDAEVAEGPCGLAFASLVDALGMKTAQRRWWGFDVTATRARLAAEGGGSRDDEAPLGGRRALVRALRSGAPVGFDEPQRELSMRADSACGVVLPIKRRGELCGLLAIESTRRRDFPEASTQRWAERAEAFALELKLAQFREWHRARHGYDVYFGHGPQAWIEPLSIAARSNAPAVLCGSHGAGKNVVARWLHFASARAAGELIECSGACDLGDALEATGAVTVVLEHVERLTTSQQAHWARRLDRAAESGARSAEPRWIVSSRAPLADASMGDALRPELRSRLERLQLRVPDLAERRTEIAPLLQLLARRFAQEEHAPAPNFEDDAIALLWRQPWPCNVRELENFVFKVVLAAPGASLRAEDVERVARRFGVELIRRVSSRQPEAALVRAALASTVNLRGTINKTRAALYLGWDPDTLVARMHDLSIDEAHFLRADAGRAEPREDDPH